MIVLDTTILIYAVGADHAYADPCREVVRLLSRGELRATTTPEVIQEFLHVRARRRDRSEAAALALSYSRLLSPLMVVTGDNLKAGLGLFEARPTLGAFDAVLAATAIGHGCRLLASADRAFTGVDELATIDPSDPAFLDRLRAASR